MILVYRKGNSISSSCPQEECVLDHELPLVSAYQGAPSPGRRRRLAISYKKIGPL